MRKGFLTSSIRYSSCSDGNAMKIKMKAGTIVQMVSSSWPSKKNRLVNEEDTRDSRP